MGGYVCWKEASGRWRGRSWCLLCSRPWPCAPFSPRASAACSALWKLSGCSCLDEWARKLDHYIEYGAAVLGSCWCVCSGWPLTGYHWYSIGTMRSSTRTPRPSATTAGSTSWPWTLAPLLSLTGPAQGSGKGVPARIPSTSPCYFTMTSLTSVGFGNIAHPQTLRRSLPWPSWWLAVSITVAGQGVGHSLSILSVSWIGNGYSRRIGVLR